MTEDEAKKLRELEARLDQADMAVKNLLRVSTGGEAALLLVRSRLRGAKLRNPWPAIEAAMQILDEALDIRAEGAPKQFQEGV